MYSQYNKNPRTINRTMSSLQSNAVLRNTYLLLSLTLIFSAFTAFLSMSANAMPMSPILTLIFYFGLFFAVNAYKNSYIGLILTFALTGFLGWTIGPILNMYIKSFSNGSELIMMALGSTGLIFLVLSAISLNPKRNFSGIRSFLSVGSIVLLIAIVVNMFLKMPALYLALSVMASLISGAYIMYITNQIIRGGEKNYIIATVMIFVSLLNIFLTLLQFLGMSVGNKN